MLHNNYVVALRNDYATVLHNHSEIALRQQLSNTTKLPGYSLLHLPPFTSNSIADMWRLWAIMKLLGIFF